MKISALASNGGGVDIVPDTLDNHDPINVEMLPVVSRNCKHLLRASAKAGAASSDNKRAGPSKPGAKA